MPQPFLEFRRFFTGTTSLAFLLLSTLGLAGWLGYQALDAAVGQRRTAEAVLRNYAEISAIEFARVARSELDDVLDEVFDPVVRRTRSRGAPSPTSVGREMDDAARDQGCECPSLRSPLLLFRVDPSDGITELVPDTVSKQTGERIARLVDLERPGPDRSRAGLVVVPVGGLMDRPVAVGYVLSDDQDGGPESTMGFVVSATALEELFQEWYDDRRLLPRPIAGDEPNDSLLYVTVEDPSGTRLFASPTAYPTTLGASAPVGPEYGDLLVRAAVRPDAASELIIGGLPSSRLPLLLVLLLLTLALGVAALVQIRREQVFQRLREDFVSGVSHELRTPLAQIRMFSELQEAGKLVTPEDERRAVSIVAREARRMSHLLDNILSFSSLQRNGEYAMPRDRIRLGDAVSEGVKAVGALAHDGAMELRVAIEPDLHVFANREAVTRIVVNLLDNAIKYGPVGQTVQVEVTRANGSARLAVTDEGPGIPEAERNRIWDPYRRLERDVKGQIPGSGIGLSVVSQLASLQGGHASVAEGPGGGARFIVELPIADEASELARASPSGLER